MGHEENGAPARVRTVCFTCGGSGLVTKTKAAIAGSGHVHSVLVREPCTQCPPDPEDESGAGKGWLPGFQPPV